ncbi:hypothetical protein K431DRAFT_135779 [Polychaeton citri CBS 116435]|uniref:Uncharacterized protein n=1 Tax=Polychaeton citri CBS 116435 TaxID=1314669 RepID=A0A9P4Q5F5_9PEZI|nr:hypothetical protein K431DRAFT_135779 [Polychaeton citri CBS 116435]
MRKRWDLTVLQAIGQDDMKRAAGDDWILEGGVPLHLFNVRQAIGIWTSRPTTYHMKVGHAYLSFLSVFAFFGAILVKLQHFILYRDTLWSRVGCTISGDGGRRNSGAERAGSNEEEKGDSALSLQDNGNPHTHTRNTSAHGRCRCFCVRSDTPIAVEIR